MPAPNTPQDIIDRIRDLERQVRDLSGRVNIRPALNTIVGGTVTIKDGGSLIVKDTADHNVLWIGRTIPDVDGQPQQATTIRRMDGSLAFAVWTGDTTGSQPVRIYDKNSQVIVADDLVNGGLAQPWVPLPTPEPVSSSAWWPSITSTTWSTLLRSVVWLQHPKLFLDAQIALGASTSGQIRFTLDGTTVATGSVNTNISGFYDVPSWSWAGVPQQRTLELQAIRTAGADRVYGQARSCYGIQS